MLTASLSLLATSLPQFFTTGFAWPREAIPAAATALGRVFPADFAIDGLVRTNQLGASIWEVSRDWMGLWWLALIYFAIKLHRKIPCPPARLDSFSSG